MVGLKKVKTHPEWSSEQLKHHDNHLMNVKMLQNDLASNIRQLQRELQGKLQQSLFGKEKELSTVAHKINTLTQELDQAIIDFQSLAQEANNLYRSLQSFAQSDVKKIEEKTLLPMGNELNIIAMHPSKLPVVEKHGLGYILKDQSVDLSQLQRSASSIKSPETLANWLAARRQEEKGSDSQN